MSWLKTTFVICLCLVSNITANPVHSIRELDSGPTTVFNTLHGSRSQLTIPVVGVTLPIANNQLSLLQHRLTESITATAAKRTNLEKRSNVYLTHYKLRSGIVPISIAAPHLKAFFDSIAFDASNAWTLLQETELLTVTRGALQMTVSCLGARIPWPLLASAAQKFSDLADHFFVNTFDAFYEASESGITVAFSLRLLKQAQGPDLTIVSLPAARRTLQRRNPPLEFTTAPLVAPGIRLTRFVQTAAMVPSDMAATMLEDFYTIIATKIITGQLADRLPSRKLVCSLWDFELTFSCDKIDVPLSFVLAFVIDMAKWSSRQFTGFYEATVRGEGPLTGLVFVVRMRLKDTGQGSWYF